ncbi:MAG: hypothetical protein ACRYE8_03055 [Janthinobacterium lividum]
MTTRSNISIFIFFWIPPRGDRDETDLRRQCLCGNDVKQQHLL